MYQTPPPPPPPSPTIATMEIVVAPHTQIKFWDAVWSPNRTTPYTPSELADMIRRRIIIGLNEADFVVSTFTEGVEIGEETEITPADWARRHNWGDLAQVIEEYARNEVVVAPNQPVVRSSSSILDFYMSHDS